jgi:predicted Fe-Mo cluster-binding NifX family protein
LTAAPRERTLKAATQRPRPAGCDIEEDAVKVLISAAAPGLDANIEPRFCESAYLTAVDLSTMDWESLPAPGAATVHAAGTRLGLLAVHQNVEAAISNDYGPNCYVVLEGAGIPMFLSGDCKTVREAAERYAAGKLRPIHAPAGARPNDAAAR